MPYLKTTLIIPNQTEEVKIYVGNERDLQQYYVKTERLGDNSYRYSIYERSLIIGYMRLHKDFMQQEVCIDTMYNQREGRYKHVGKALHEIAFKASIKLGCGGRVRLGTGYGSFLFHYACGFRYGRWDHGKFPWTSVQNPELGETAYRNWLSASHPELNDSQLKLLSQYRSYNEVLIFYRDLYRQGDQKIQESIRAFLASFGEVLVKLTSEAIESKIKEYGLENPTDAVLPESEPDRNDETVTSANTPF